MTARVEFTSDDREKLVRGAWYRHDARWFAAVAAEFGLEAANRLNRGALRAASRGEMRAIMKTAGVEKAAGLGEFLELFDAGAGVFVPSELMDFEARRVDEKSYEVKFNRCFVHENVVKAGIAGVYVCAVFDRVASWHEAAGLPLADEPEALPCAMAQGRECRRRLTIK